jgi:hypothetical protein
VQRNRRNQHHNIVSGKFEINENPWKSDVQVK